MTYQKPKIIAVTAIVILCLFLGVSPAYGDQEKGVVLEETLAGTEAGAEEQVLSVIRGIEQSVLGCGELDYDPQAAQELFALRDDLMATLRSLGDDEVDPDGETRIIGYLYRIIDLIKEISDGTGRCRRNRHTGRCFSYRPCPQGEQCNDNGFTGGCNCHPI